MTEQSRIPIRNLYYLLCYSWNQLKQGEIVDVSKVPTTEIVDLFAFVLCEGIQHLVRRGLGQGYESHHDEIVGIRGRMDVLRSARRFLPTHGQTACDFDEITTNTLPNQILKSTLRQLARTPELNAELCKRVKTLHRDLRGIDDIIITTLSFRRVQLHANNRFYRFLLNVCEFIHCSWLVDQQTGTFRFRDFLRDERAMARVFQNFLYNFIKLEISKWKVRREHIIWQAIGINNTGLELLPRMETDISLECDTQHLIIDAKYYQNTLIQHHDTSKIHSGHLYQLMSYLTNAKRKDGEMLQGMLIYPYINRKLREKYEIQGFGLSIFTVDLSRDWKDVRGELFELLGENSEFTQC